MRALVLNGAKSGDDDLRAAEAALERELAAAGWEVGAVLLHRIMLAWCTGCFECWTKTPGECKTKDSAGDIARAMMASDLTVFLTPVTFGGYSSPLKKALDRLICLVSPFFQRIDGEVHHRKRYDRYPSLLGVGVLDEPDGEEERIFSTLVERNAINVHAPDHASLVLYHGTGRETAETLLRPFVERFTVRESA
ncbi:MAG: NAD(P)H-dependent oxidoreductase [Gemmatimonadota bacterium]|nr:NAD(P)H-dependent oxidoreductase [Gemmatimonadota bacterium]